MSLINEIKQILSEVTTVNFQGQKFVLKVDVNEDPTCNGFRKEIRSRVTINRNESRER